MGHRTTIQKAGAGLLAACLIAVGIAGTSAQPADAAPTEVLSVDFDDGTLGTLTRSGSPTLSYVPDASGGQALSVGDRVQTWDSVQTPTGLFAPDISYTLSADVRLAAGTTGTRTAHFTVDDGSYAWVGTTNASADGWSTIQGSYTLPAGVTPSTVKASIEVDLGEGDVTPPDFLLDNVVLTANEAPPPIDPGELPEPGTVVLETGFESGLDGWVAREGNAGPHQVAVTTDDAHSGDASALVSGRTNQGSGIGVDTTGLLVAGATYEISAWVRYADGQPTDRMVLSHQRTTGTADSYTTLGQSTDITNDSWNQISVTFTMPHTDASFLYFETRYTATGGNTSDFLVDDVVLRVAPPPPPPAEDPDVPFVPETRPGPVAPSVGAFESGEYRNLFTEWDPTLSQADVQAKLDAYWTSFFESTDDDERLYYPAGTDADGDLAYILDVGNDDIRSEGMSYGMMIAVQMDKQAEFDALWNWAKTYMQHDTGPRTGYFCWQAMRDGVCADPNPASDGEEYFATALFFAGNRWGDDEGIYDYTAEANAILDTMLHKEDMNGGVVDGITNMFNHEQEMIVFVPEGSAAEFSDPSYHLPAFYELWARWAEGWDGNQEADRAFWKAAAERSRDYFVEATHPSTGLNPDYAHWDGTPVDWGNHADFRFDAWRTVVNWSVDYAWFAEDTRQQVLSDRLQSFFERKGMDTYANQWTLYGRSLSVDHSPGLVASNAVGSLSATDGRAWKFVEALWDTEPSTGQWRYYDGLLNFMALLHASGDFQVYGPADVTDPGTPVPPVVPDPTPEPTEPAPWAPPSGLSFTDANRGPVSVPDTARPGETITVTVGAAHAGETVQVWMYSDPRHLVTGTVSPSGTIIATIPQDATLGAHRIAVFDAEGQLIGWDDLQVVGAGLAVTGGDLFAPVLAALMLALLGSTLVVVRRRRAGVTEAG